MDVMKGKKNTQSTQIGKARSETINANRLPERTRRSLGHRSEAKERGVSPRKTPLVSISAVKLVAAVVVCLAAAIGMITVMMT